MNGKKEKLLKPSETKFWIYLGVATFLVIFAGLCSGLTVGYLSIDTLQLEVKCKTGTPQEERQAKKILPILQQ